jgi:hypothetical protein
MGVTYAIELYDSNAQLGPGARVAEVYDARSVGWAAYDRLASPAFFTLLARSPHLAKITPLLTHVAVWRLGTTATQVWAGIVADTDRMGDDVIVRCWDYLALLAVSRAGFQTMYPGKKLGTEIVAPEWNAAKTATGSPLAFVATGTIEDPVGTDGTTPIKTNAEFGTLDQQRLKLFWDLSEIGRANTDRQVTFEITRTPPYTFNFWANAGTARNIELTIGRNIDDYRWLPNWMAYRNDLAAIAMDAAGGPSEIVVSDAAEIAARGRRQGTFTPATLLGISGATTETDQLKAAAERELRRRTRHAASLMLSLVPGSLAPFDGYALNDTVRVAIEKDADLIDAAWRIVGLRVLFGANGEQTAMFVVPT